MRPQFTYIDSHLASVSWRVLWLPRAHFQGVAAAQWHRTKPVMA
jgi:hypothetical protein